MNRRRLGKTGFEVSEIGLGCWQLGGDFGPVEDEQASAILGMADRLGVNFWDTADVYGGGLSESRIGHYLGSRTDVRVATKLGRSGDMFPDNFTKDGMRKALESSAERLGVTILDLAQLHCVPGHWLEEGKLFDHMEDFKSEGVIRHWGVSVETVDQGLLCLKHPGVASLQIIFNLFRQDAADELLPKARAADVGIIVRLPLASGLLSGKFGKDHKFAKTDHRNFNRDGQLFNVGETFSGLPFEIGVDLVRELQALAPQGWPLAQFAIRWILDHPAVSSVIAGVTRPEQLAANVAAASLPRLDKSTMEKLSAFYRDRVRPHVRGEI
jgi:aryl-alcohol dehydrogenase-like predicted oxidoreductase